MSLSQVQVVYSDPPPLKRSKMTIHSNNQINQTSFKGDSNGDSLHKNLNDHKQKNIEKNNHSDEGNFDHNLYSRQFYAIGESAMVNLRKSNVLISGIGSVGVEIAKNLILGGVRRVTIHDTKVVKWNDLSAQFYVTELDLNKNRAEACFIKLEELNDSVHCTLLTEDLTEEIVKKYDLIVLTDASFEYQIKVNEWMRKHKKMFISADARGLFGYIFVDLGEQFCINDEFGEQIKEVFIEHINGETGDFYTLEKSLHGFVDGDYVSFSEVRGMTELNSLEPVKIKVVAPHIFNIGDVAAKFKPYIDGGRVRQVKMPKYVSFMPLQTAIKNPSFLTWDFAKIDEPKSLHALWQALYKFEEKYDRSPNVRSIVDANLLKAELPNGTEEISEKLLNNFSFQSTGNLQPIASIVGGITAQEAIKAVTHHTTPLNQFLYISCLEALPGEYSSLNADKLIIEDCLSRNNRYDGQAAVFGWEFQKALEQQKWFIVGAGAIGCELLKNMAMIGLGCGENGKIQITDMDTIEVSNLNRQFLFRRKDVGKKKSDVAANAVKKFNPKINIEAFSEQVSENTIEFFNDDFFENLTGVANALDNVSARRYVDRRCVFYGLPLLDSGTMGAKGSTQVIYPHLTESYSSSNDPPEKETPTCTLKNFPYQIEHTIQWAKSNFDDLFTSTAEQVNCYLNDVKGFLDRNKTSNLDTKIQSLSNIKKALIDEKPNSSEDCITWARTIFQDFFYNNIAQLLHNFPADHKNEHGINFWSGLKRCPKVIKFDIENPYHVDFVYTASILRAQQYNLEPILDRDRVARFANAIEFPEFKPSVNVKIAVNDLEAETQKTFTNYDEDSEIIFEKLNVCLARLKLSDNLKLKMIDFEKDDDTNHHVDFVTAASNIRANNYNIEIADRIKTKQIAGKIIPALATTTSIVSGLVLIELYKIIEKNGKRANTPLEKFKNSFCNLAQPFYGFSEPIAAPKKKFSDKVFTLWDCIEIVGPKTLGEIINYIADYTGLTVSMISSGVSLIYAFFQPKSKIEYRLKKEAFTVVEEVTQKKLPDKKYSRYIIFEAITNVGKDDVEIPYIKYCIP